MLKKTLQLWSVFLSMDTYIGRYSKNLSGVLIPHEFHWDKAKTIAEKLGDLFVDIE